MYDLFLDTDFFRLDPLCMQFWKAIIDHLMTYDNTTFKDLMTRITMSQSGAINIFANREQVTLFTSQMYGQITHRISSFKRRPLMNAALQ